MPPMSSKVDPIALAEKVFAILSSGSFSSTYKYALLLAIIDLCIEKVGRKRLPGESVTITTHELAEQVVELYWPQCAPWDGEVLRQGGGRGEQAKILRSITGFRAGLQGTKSPSLCLAKRDFPGEYLRLLQDVEWVLIEMPIPRLQRVASQEYRFLYDHACDDAKKSHVAGGSASHADHAALTGLRRCCRVRSMASFHLSERASARSWTMRLAEGCFHRAPGRFRRTAMRLLQVASTTPLPTGRPSRRASA